MRKPPLGEYNHGALAGAIVGSIGGLFAIGVVRAVLGRNIALILSLPILGMASWIICGIAGWLAGARLARAWARSTIPSGWSYWAARWAG